MLNGCNSSVFAYGQTGSGKTYTISGGAKKRDGVIQLAVKKIRHRLIKANFPKAVMKCYMIQLYKSDIVDLLRPANVNPVALDIIEDAKTNLIEV
jgi:hypothetical protein